MPDSPKPIYTILAPGFAKWWGSDGRALGQAFRRLGHNLIEIDEEDYVPWRWEGFVPKASRRLLSSALVTNYNEAVLRQASSSFYDFVLVFKGNLLRPDTIRALTMFGKPIFNFYPDTNFVDYGSNIPGALALYDCVFTTKSFHGEHEMREFGIKDLRHVRHGFDPEVHRPIPLTAELNAHYSCDVSFVGCWSPENEQRILYILENRPHIKVKVFGLGWNNSSGDFQTKLGNNLSGGAFGDELSIVYCASKINLGLLRRAQSDRNIRDLTTARTFQIPAAGAFMLHEDTAEVRTLFEAGKEVLLFKEDADMIDMIDVALKTPMLRASISKQGYQRCLREPYDYSSAAGTVLRYFETGRVSQSNVTTTLEEGRFERPTQVRGTDIAVEETV